ncbi:MAG TPA: thiamine pyrophosphate-dependent enzyme [Jatrophihabitans sp.]|nr:thiamine pyrophosphate-dependent enzyme [Jatrophihabitans sp.]
MALTLAAVARQLLARHPDACVVSSCGYPSRELYNAGDRPGNFYLVGSMGMAAPIALGIASIHPRLMVIAIDGDGSLLMNLGVLPMVAAARPRLIHVVCDNGMHESTGGQATTQRADFVALALAAGYRSAIRIEQPAELAEAEPAGTPTLLHVLTEPRRGGIGQRVQLSPRQLVERLQPALN